MSRETAREEHLAAARRHWEQAKQATAEARVLLTPGEGESDPDPEDRAEADSLMRLADSYVRLAQFALRLAETTQDETSQDDEAFPSH
jgi:hypothetical protein